MVLCLSCKVVWGRKRLKNIWFNLFILPSVTICWGLVSCCETLPVSAGQTTAITFHEKLRVHTDAFVVCWDKAGTFQRCCDIEGGPCHPKETIDKAGCLWQKGMLCSLQSQAKCGGSHCGAALTPAPFGVYWLKTFTGSS